MKGSFVMHYLIVTNSYKDIGQNDAKYLREKILKRDSNSVVDIISETEINTVDKDIYSFVFGIGGDGTVLHLLHNFSDIPVYCFNKGRVGFLADGLMENVDSILDNIILYHQYTVSMNNFLNIKINDKTYHCVNDVLVGKYTMPGTVELSLFIDDEIVKTFICDGILVSSGLGSSAYNLSLGGPLLYNGLKALSISVIGSNALGFPKIILSESSNVKIRVNGRKKNTAVGLLGVDGTYITKDLYDFDNIVINYSHRTYQLLRLYDYSYLKAIKSKIL